MTVSVRTTPRADNEILVILRWWRENRPAAPNLFEEELAEASTRLATQPEIGMAFSRPRAPKTRRLLLRRTRYHVYYEHDDEGVLVHAVWGAVRGRPPRVHSRR